MYNKSKSNTKNGLFWKAPPMRKMPKEKVVRQSSASNTARDFLSLGFGVAALGIGVKLLTD